MSATEQHNDLHVSEEQQEQPSTIKIKSKRRHGWLLWLLGALLFPFVLLGTLSVLLYFPPFQQWAVNNASGIISEKTGWDVRVGRIYLSFPLHLKLWEVEALSTATRDTIATLNHLDIDLPVAPLLKGHIPVTAARIRGLKLDYTLPDSTLYLKGDISSLEAHNLLFDIKGTRLTLGSAYISDGDAYVYYHNSNPKPPKKSSKPSTFVLSIGKAHIERLKGIFTMNRDTNLVDVTINSAKVHGTIVNIADNAYSAAAIQLDGKVDRAAADLDFLPYPWQVQIETKDAYYDLMHRTHADVLSGYFRAGDGWEVNRLKAKVHKDTTALEVKELDVALRQSNVRGEVVMPFDQWMPSTKGKARVALRGKIAMSEIERFGMQQLGFPQTAPIDFILESEGVLDDKIDFVADIEAPGLVKLKSKGKLLSLFSSDRRKAQIKLYLEGGAVMSTLGQLGVKSQGVWQIPEGVRLEGDIDYSNDKVKITSTLMPPKGVISLDAVYQPKRKSYKADVVLDRVDLRTILPSDTISLVSGRLRGEGRGFDLFDSRTQADVELVIDTLRYRSSTFSGLTLISQIKDNLGFVAINSESEQLRFSTQVDAVMRPDDLLADINIKVDTLVPAALGMRTKLLEGASLELRSSLRTDLKQHYSFKGEIEETHLSTDRGLIRPANIYLDALSTDSLLKASVKSGDLNIDFNSQNGLNEFTGRLTKLTKEIKNFTADTTGITDISPWLALYPDMHLSFTMGRNNALRSYLDEHLLGWQRVRVELGTTTHEGVSGEIYVKGFQKGTYRLDEMDMVIRQDSSFFYGVASVNKERFRDQAPYNAMLSLTSNVHRTELFTQVTDEKNRNFLQLGLDLTKQHNGDLTFAFTPDPQVLAYNSFKVQGLNYLTLPTNNRMTILADLALITSDSASIHVHHVDQVGDAPHTIRADIRHFGLERIKELPFVPDMDGVVNLSADFIQQPQGYEYGVKANISSFSYDKKRIGNVALEGHVVPTDKGAHARALLSLDDKQVGTMQAFTGKSKGAKPLWQLSLSQLPIERANPFLPASLAELRGKVDGYLSNYQGSDIITAKAADIQGHITLDEAMLFVPMINESFALDNRSIEVRNNKVYLDKYKLTFNDKSQLTTHGTLDLADNMRLDLRLQGDDMLLLDSKRTDQTILHGRLNADADLTLKGPARSLSVRGKVAVNGNSNLTYVVKDSPLERRNKLEGLIEFADFSDTLFMARRSTVDTLSLGGMDVRLSIHIDPAMRATAILTPDESNKIYIQGGGDLNFSLPPYGQMALFGTYEVGDGYLNYSIPPIPSRRFTVQRDSRVTWSGPLLNPNIDFKATSRISSTVTDENEASRKVNFDVSLIAKNNVDNLAILYTMDAPEDLQMRNTLAALTDEERGRQAIMMLATGTYLGSKGSTTGGFDMNATLSSLITSQLNNLMGEALGADINLGVESGSEATGGGTNYSYSIAKKFYNDRINVSIGGRVETGNAAREVNQSFINNMSVDYRLDQAGTHYLRLFHKKNYENLLDGEVVETGVGYVMRRKLNSLLELIPLHTPLRAAGDSIIPRQRRNTLIRYGTKSK